MAGWIRRFGGERGNLGRDRPDVVERHRAVVGRPADLDRMTKLAARLCESAQRGSLRGQLSALASARTGTDHDHWR